MDPSNRQQFPTEGNTSCPLGRSDPAPVAATALAPTGLAASAAVDRRAGNSQLVPPGVPWARCAPMSPHPNAARVNQIPLPAINPTYCAPGTQMTYSPNTRPGTSFGVGQAVAEQSLFVPDNMPATPAPTMQPSGSGIGRCNIASTARNVTRPGMLASGGNQSGFRYQMNGPSAAANDHNFSSPFASTGYSDGVNALNVHNDPNVLSTGLAGLNSQPAKDVVSRNQGPILCCRRLQWHNKPTPPTDVDEVEDRHLFFLCSYGSGKKPVADPNPSGPLSRSDFIGVIEVAEFFGSKEEFGLVNTRWFAIYRPGHKYSSAIDCGGRTSSGPEGKYAEIAHDKATHAINTLKTLTKTPYKAKYEHCRDHNKTHFEARYFHLEVDQDTDSGLRDTTMPDDRTKVYRQPRPKKRKRQATDESEDESEDEYNLRYVYSCFCSKCRKLHPAVEFNANVYTGNPNDSYCYRCQKFRHHSRLQDLAKPKNPAKLGGENDGGAAQGDPNVGESQGGSLQGDQNDGASLGGSNGGTNDASDGAVGGAAASPERSTGVEAYGLLSEDLSTATSELMGGI